MDRLSINSVPSLIADNTPAVPGVETFETETPSFDNVETLEDDIPPPSTDETHTHVYPPSSLTLTSADLKSDPILSSLAKQQRRTSHFPTTELPTQQNTFKARPAPVHKDNVGPRMTKSSALRLGIKWEEKKGERESVVLGFEHTPGHKRASMGIVSSALGMYEMPRVWTDPYDRTSLRSLHQ